MIAKSKSILKGQIMMSLEENVELGINLAEKKIYRIEGIIDALTKECMKYFIVHNCNSVEEAERKISYSIDYKNFLYS